MSAFRVNICKSPGWRNFTTCTLGVSVTSPNWQRERFASILDFAAKHFSRIRIDLTDALYRHSFAGQGLSDRTAFARAETLGTAWLQEHRKFLAPCPIEPEVIRWASWYRHQDYAEVELRFNRAEADSPVLRAALAADLDAFFRRKGHPPDENELKHAKQFLMEELVVLTLQAREMPSVRLYPGKQLRCMQAVAGGLVPEAPRGLECEQFAKVTLRSRVELDTKAALATRPRSFRTANTTPANQAQLALP